MALALIIAEAVVACETVWTFPAFHRGGDIKMHVQLAYSALHPAHDFSYHGFVDDDKTRGGSTFPEEVAGEKHHR
jgi:hypothetical protein